MDYLYALQVARESWAQFLTPVLYVVSEFAFYGVPLVAIMLYLCVDKVKYERMAFSLIAANFLANFIKVIVCVYRPWISDSRLHVAPLAEHSSSGYSCPSGHTTGGTIFYGSLAVNNRNNKKRVAVCIALILLTAFSRNWLGAHTILDVVAAIIISAACIWACNMLLDYIYANPEKDKLVALLGILIAVAGMIICLVKPYPMDYAADGSLLCDPILTQKDTWLAIGFMVAWFISWYVDRHYTNFTTVVPVKTKVIRGIIGALLFALLYEVIMKKITAPLDIRPGSFIRGFVTIGVCAGIYPAVFTWLENRKKVGSQNERG